MIAVKQPLSFREKIRLLRGHIQTLAPWPVACVTLMVGVWLLVLSTIQHEKSAITERALSSVTAQAQTYADQLERNVGQLDYILLSLKFHWQKSGGALNLEEQVDAGLVPKAAKISVTVVDQAGMPVTTTIPALSGKQSVASIEYFQFHSANPSKDLHISKPVRSILTGRDVVFLSRRLDGKAGEFSGVIVIAIEPLFLGSFVDETQLGKDDFVSIRRLDGAFFASKTGDSLRSPGPLFKGNPFTAGPNGVRAVPASNYADRKPRIVAWKTTTSYPIVSVVGVSEEGLLKGYQSRKHELLLIGTTSTLLLLFVCIGGVRRAALRILKTHHVSQVHASYRVATENAKEGFYILRPLYDNSKNIVDFLIEDCNERGAMYRGLSRETLIGKTLSSMSPAHHRKDMLQACRQAMETGFVEDEMQESQHGSRAIQWLQRRIVRSSVGLAMTLRDVTEIKLHQEALVEMANADALTSLPNRHWLMDYLPTAIHQARRDGIKLAIMFVDLDDFKNINDTLGHPIGDEVLKAAASRLKAVIRPEDKVARLGGDEFTVIAHTVESRDDVAAVADRVINAFRSPFTLSEGKRHYSVYATVGISMFPEDGDDGETLIKKADIAMYTAKGSTKGTYCFFELSQEHRLVTRITRQAELKLAIERRELILHYQPRVNGATGEITSMEALVRWNHPTQGCMPPNEFIALAEKTGLIVPLGTEVVRMACEQLAQWKDQGLRVVPISVNVAPQQINTGTSSSMLVSALRAYGLTPDMIEVEITESATVTEEGDAVTELATIQDAGIKLYVDDFGTGYSCLAQLKRLHMDGLKIDRAFTAQLLNGPADTALFEAIVSMAHALGMRVVAEGVETAEQLAALQSLGCEEVQGYFISKPVPANEAKLLLEKQFLFPAPH